MKKVLFGILGLVVALVAAVLVVPSFIDWNDYKAEIASQAKAATGRALVIDGDIKLALLPAPTLVAHDVRLANIEGASAPEMVQLRSLRVRLALGPLLGGNVQVETLELIEPVIELETLADGRQNWVLTTAPDDDPASGGAPAATGDGKGNGESVALRPTVRVDSFVIVNGTLVYRDSRNGTAWRVEELNARIAAASLAGPFESSGQFRIGGFPLGYEVSIGKIIHGRTVPFTMRLDVAPAVTAVQVDGTLVSLGDAPKMKGTVTVRGANLAGLANSLAAIGPLPGFLSQSFEAGGAVVASADGAEIKDLTLRLGGSQATGNLTVRLGETTAVAAALSVAHVDLDRWLSLPADDGLSELAEAWEKTRQADRQRQQETGEKSRASIPLDAPLKPPRRSPGSGTFALPTNVNGSFSVSMDAVTFRGGLIRKVRANAELAGGELTISQLSAQFPGSSEFALFGFIGTADGEPWFEGEIECSISDLRRVLNWLGVEPPPVPADRLRKLTLNGRLKVTPKQVDIAELKLNLDSSRITGAVTVPLRQRFAFGANLTVDRLNLDAYLPPAAPSSAGDGAKPRDAGDGSRLPAGAGSRAQTAAGAWRLLTEVDANLVARVKSMVYNRTPIKDVVFEGTLFDGALQVRRASVANLAGATVMVKGTVRGFAGVPEVSGLSFDFRAGDVSRLFRLVGIEPPVPPKKLGRVTLQGTVEGSILEPRFDLTVNAAGARVVMNGSVSLLRRPMVDVKVKVRHPDVPRLLRALDVDYRPAAARFGGLDIAAAVKGDPSALAFSEVSGKIGPVSVAGSGTLDLRRPRPKVTATLQTGEIVVQGLLPAARTARAAPGFEPFSATPGVVPASWPAPPRPAIASQARPVAAGGRWPRKPLDLSALKAFDADLKLKSTAITYERYTVRNADVVATLTDGVLRVEPFTGVLYGGPLTGKVVVFALPVPRIEAALNLKDVDVRRTLKALTGKDMASGTLEMDLNLAGRGRSVADVIAALSGGGTIGLRKLDVRGSARGTALAGILGLLVRLNRLGGAKRGAGLAEVTASFAIDRGVARSRDMRLVSSLGEGRAQGLVDLSKWFLDVSGEVRLASNVLTEILSRATKTQATAPVLPFRIRGNLDAPKVKLDTSRLATAGQGLPLPGLDKLLKKKGIGEVLRRIIPGARPAAPESQDQPPAAAQQEPPPPPPAKTLRPEDILKGLLKKIR